MNDTQALPNNLATYQAIIVEQARAVVEQNAEIAKLTQLVEGGEFMLNELMQRAYRQRSERYHEDPKQLKLDLGGTPEAADAAAGLADAVEEAQVVIAEHKHHQHKPRKPRDESLPHLPREEVVLEAAGRNEALCFPPSMANEN